MNTFFPTLQLFFESGISCTIEGGQLPGALIGLDPELRFRMTDCTHEEDGQIIKTVIPDKFARSGTGLIIREAIIARRTSTAIEAKLQDCKPAAASSSPSISFTHIAQDHHIVVGIRLKGMKKMAYVWAKAEHSARDRDTTWGDVRIAGLSRNVPSPFVGFPGQEIKSGGEIAVVTKISIINRKTLGNNIAES